MAKKLDIPNRAGKNGNTFMGQGRGSAFMQQADGGGALTAVAVNPPLTGDGTLGDPISLDDSIYLQTVEHDASLTGDGTNLNPLSVNWPEMMQGLRVRLFDHLLNGNVGIIIQATQNTFGGASAIIPTVLAGVVGSTILRAGSAVNATARVAFGGNASVSGNHGTDFVNIKYSDSILRARMNQLSPGGSAEFSVAFGWRSSTVAPGTVAGPEVLINYDPQNKRGLGINNQNWWVTYRESAVSTPVVVDTGVLADTAWHNFRIVRTKAAAPAGTVSYSLYLGNTLLHTFSGVNEWTYATGLAMYYLAEIYRNATNAIGASSDISLDFLSVEHEIVF